MHRNSDPEKQMTKQENDLSTRQREETRDFSQTVP